MAALRPLALELAQPLLGCRALEATDEADDFGGCS